MRRIALLVILAACQSVPKKPYRPPPPLSVEDVATWFIKAALSGDDATARTLTLRHDQIAQFTTRPDTEERWETIVKETLDQLGREGGGEDAWRVDANVVERRLLEPGKDEKVTAPVEIAIVKLTVNDAGSVPFLFVNTAEGWKFSPKK